MGDNLWNQCKLTEIDGNLDLERRRDRPFQKALRNARKPHPFSTFSKFPSTHSGGRRGHEGGIFSTNFLYFP